MVLMASFSFGVQEATCAIIGNCIGSNNVPLAKRFFSLITKVTVSLVIIIALSILLLRQAILDFYTDDIEVQEICFSVFLVIAINFLFDGLQIYLQGPIRAMGLQSTASYFAIGVYWMIGLPFAAFLSFKMDLGVLGLQLGFSIAVFT